MALSHREADRIPISDSFWDATIDRWRKEGLPFRMSVEDYFNFDLGWAAPDISPMFPVEILEEDNEYIIERDVYGGIRKNHRDRSTTPMIIDYPCKNRGEWEKIKLRLKPSNYRVDWVSGLQRHYWERSRKRFITYNVVVGFNEVLNYVAFPHLLKLIIKNPEWVKDMYHTLANLAMDMCDLMIKGGFKFDGAWLGCDLGYKDGLFFSIKHFEDQLHPVFKELVQYFHSRDMLVIFHCCGRVKDLIPYFIEEGIDCLQPLEVKSGMDLIELKEKYGDKIAFMGGIDVRLMSLDNPKPIEKEIRRKILAAKEGGGYIYHSDHSVPKDVSLEQYKRVIALIHKYGNYDS